MSGPIKKPITIVVPVYGDWDSLSVCIESLIATIDHSVDQVMLVNDCGPDADVIEKNIKRSTKGRDNFFYHRNEQNIGFVRTCNRAVLELETTNNDILLLNSDASLTEGALDELRALIAVEKRIGAVSPRSNNATICTIPIAAIDQKGIQRKWSYRLFKKYNQRYERFTQVPTGHGFCMLIRREAIKKVGLFDEVFGRGYGEEVDFSQRIQAKGWICAVSNWSFVYHLEARSFSFETKKELLETNGKIVRERYPTYKAKVQESIRLLKAEERRIFSAADRRLVSLSVNAIKLRKKIHQIKNR